VSEKAKLIRGDPPKIDFKKKGEPPKNTNINVKKSVIVDFDSFVIKTAWVFRVSNEYRI
jgi:hypothetical protein